MSSLHYLAYGSNLHPLRLRERVPSAALLGIVRLSGHSVVFHKISPDGSSKCDLVESGRSSTAFGALYAIDSCHVTILDTCEGRGAGYDRTLLPVSFRGQALRPFTYRASPTHINPALKPFCWYRDLVLVGAEFLDLPQGYRHQLATTASQPDPDPARRCTHSALLARIRQCRDRGQNTRIQA